MKTNYLSPIWVRSFLKKWTSKFDGKNENIEEFVTNRRKDNRS